MSSTSESPKNTARTAVLALARIGIAAAVFAGTYVMYAKSVETSKAVKESAVKARDLIVRDGIREYRDAARLLDEALSLKAGDAYALATRGEVAAILWAENGYAEAEAEARNFTRQTIDAKINFAERFGAEGLVMLGEGKVDEAEAAMRTLAEQGLADARILANLGVAHARQNKLALSKNDLKQAADREWRSPRFSNIYGEISFDNADFTTAIGAHSKALEASPGHARALVGKARAEVARGERVAEALESFETVLARSAEEVSPVVRERALTGKAEALFASAEFEKAEAAAREALAVGAKVDPAIAHAHFVLGKALAAQKKDGAAESINTALKLYPAVSRFWFDGAVALARAGKGAEGESILDTYAKAQEQNDAYLIARGDFYVATGDFKKAHESYDEAIKKNEVNPEGFYKKGALFANEGRQPKADRKKSFDAALAQFEKAVSIRQKYADVYREVGLIYLDLNPRSGEALEQFGTALKYYKEQKAPKSVFDAFIAEVEARYTAAKLENNAKAWRAEAAAFTR